MSEPLSKPNKFFLKNCDRSIFRFGLVGLGCKVKACCPHVRLGPGSSMGIFLSDPSPYLREFRRKSRKTPNDWADKYPGIEPSTSHQPVLRAEPLGHWWGFYTRKTPVSVIFTEITGSNEEIREWLGMGLSLRGIFSHGHFLKRSVTPYFPMGD